MRRAVGAWRASALTGPGKALGWGARCYRAPNNAVRKTGIASEVRDLMAETLEARFGAGCRRMPEAPFRKGRMCRSWWRRLSRRMGEAAACGIYFPSTDSLGKPVLMLDGSRRVAGTGEHDPFSHVNRVKHGH